MAPDSSTDPADEAMDRERRCIATGTVGPAETRVRFVRDPDGCVVPDLAARLPGRGAWVVADRAALDKAVARRLFARAFRTNIEVAPGLADWVEHLLAKRCIELIGLSRRASQAVSGFGKVEGQLRGGQVGVLLTAREGAEDGRRRLYGLAADTPRVGVLDAVELGLAFGRESVVHAALAPGRLADRLLAESRRLAGFRGMGDTASGVSGTDRAARLDLPDHDERNGLADEAHGRVGRGPEPLAQMDGAAPASAFHAGTLAAQTA